MMIESRKQLFLKYDAWTKLDSVSIYEDWIGQIRTHAKHEGYSSLSEWELFIYVIA
jgi:hypothetical protein